MSFWVYKTFTIIHDTNLLSEDAQLTLFNLTPYVFKPGNVPLYQEIVKEYVNDGRQIGFKRWLNGNILISERIYDTQETALECKNRLDVLYNENTIFHNEQGYSNKFTFTYEIVEISEQDFINNYAR